MTVWNNVKACYNGLVEIDTTEANTEKSVLVFIF